MFSVLALAKVSVAPDEMVRFLQLAVALLIAGIKGAVPGIVISTVDTGTVELHQLPVAFQLVLEPPVHRPAKEVLDVTAVYAEEVHPPAVTAQVYVPAQVVV